jgi:hypothetical protein
VSDMSNLGEIDRSGHPSEDTRNPLVVVVIDGSGPWWNAVKWACREAQRLNGHVLAVVSDLNQTALAISGPFALAGESVYELLVSALTDDARALGEEARNYANDVGVQLTYLCAQGDIVKELSRIAVNHRPELIVIGRATKAHRLFGGSLGRYVVEMRSAPIIVVVP